MEKEQCHDIFFLDLVTHNMHGIYQFFLMFFAIRSVDFIIDKVIIVDDALKIRYIGSMCLDDIIFQRVFCYFYR